MITSLSGNPEKVFGNDYINAFSFSLFDTLLLSVYHRNGTFKTKKIKMGILGNPGSSIGKLSDFIVHF